MKHFSLLLALCAALSTFAQSEQQIEDILSRMTLDEKIAIIHAQSKFSSPGVPRLGIPGLWCSDGPHGVRAEVLWDEWNQAGWTSDSCVAFPALTCLAATWNTSMSRLYGENLAEEALYRGKNVMLAPGVNIFRTPLNGRNFEYMGEDPYLASRMVVPYIQGVQSKGVAACVKHFALNNQETYRHLVDVNVSDRALYEIYLPAFKAAVTEAGVWSIMGSYNRYKGQYNCHNEYLLNNILRDEWGFDGAVISDWGGCQETPQAITNGLDLEYGTWTDGLTMGATNSYDVYYLATPYKQLIQEGKVGTEELDNKVRNVLRLIFRTSMNPNRGFGALHSDEHYAAARQIATEGIVLLKNQAPNPTFPQKGKEKSLKIDILPITPLQGETEGATILVVGENAILPMTVGGGSSSLKVQREVSPLQGITERAAKEGIQVEYARGYKGIERIEQDKLEVDLSENRSADELRAEAIAKAQEADVVIFIGGLNKDGHQDCEGVDREQYGLPYGQDELIEALYKANPNLVVVNISGTAVAMPWAKKVPAIVQAWYLGSEAGHAIADVLFGDVNPSGKMPFSIMAKLTDYPAHQYGELGYPGIPDPKAEGKFYEEYKEDIFVGYRYADKAKVNPTFPFGHGLSYTSFEYSNITLLPSTSTPLHLTVTVTNTGKVAGAEVVQVYVGENKPTVARPMKELKAFEKVYLNSGESKTVTFTLDSSEWGYWDEAKHQFVTNEGKYTIYVGSSSRDIRYKQTIKL